MRNYPSHFPSEQLLYLLKKPGLSHLNDEPARHWCTGMLRGLRNISRGQMLRTIASLGVFEPGETSRAVCHRRLWPHANCAKKEKWQRVVDGTVHSSAPMSEADPNFSACWRRHNRPAPSARDLRNWMFLPLNASAVACLALVKPAATRASSLSHRVPQTCAAFIRIARRMLTYKHQSTAVRLYD